MTYFPLSWARCLHSGIVISLSLVPGLIPLSPSAIGLWSRYHPTYPGRPSRVDKEVQVRPGRLCSHSWLGLVPAMSGGSRFTRRKASTFFLFFLDLDKWMAHVDKLLNVPLCDDSVDTHLFDVNLPHLPSAASLNSPNFSR